MTRWSLPGRILELRRWPPRADDPLQAWDGADRHLVAAVEEEDLGGPLLVVGDAWGALATALGDRVGGSWGDSVLGERATGANRARAGLPPLPWTPSTARPAGEFAGALVRVPRAHRRLRFWLAELAAVLPSGAPVWIGGRHGDVTRRVVAAAEAMGPAEASLQRHKARIVRTSVQRRPAPPEPRSVEVEGVRLRPRPGVFGEDGLDDGAALLLRHLPAGAPRRVLDLGCGSGVLGLVAQARWPEAALTFCDASHLAVASARDGATTPATFCPCDAGDGVAAGVDLVLCNPPFHAGRARTRAVAARMFGQAARVLEDDGALLVVGNRHLDYHLGLRRWFGRVEVRSADPRFVVIEARSPRRDLAASGEGG
jgi:23S rRNA (guanine1835-N2)-methyltransferase